MEVVKPRDAPNVANVRVSVADVSNHRPQFGPSLRDSSVAQRAVPTMLVLRHEMDAQDAVSIGRVVPEAPERRSRECWTMLVPLQGALEQVLVFPILWNTMDEGRPLRGTRFIRQSEAPAQVRVSRDGRGPCQPTQPRVGRGNAKLQVKVVFIEPARHSGILAHRAGGFPHAASEVVGLRTSAGGAQLARGSDVTDRPEADQRSAEPSDG